jgi:hypothetical protein
MQATTPAPIAHRGQTVVASQLVWKISRPAYHKAVASIIHLNAPCFVDPRPGGGGGGGIFFRSFKMINGVVLN